MMCVVVCVCVCVCVCVLVCVCVCVCVSPYLLCVRITKGGRKGVCYSVVCVCVCVSKPDSTISWCVLQCCVWSRLPARSLCVSPLLTFPPLGVCGARVSLQLTLHTPPYLSHFPSHSPKCFSLSVDVLLS